MPDLSDEPGQSEDGTHQKCNGEGNLGARADNRGDIQRNEQRITRRSGVKAQQQNRVGDQEC